MKANSTFPIPKGTFKSLQSPQRRSTYYSITILLLLIANVGVGQVCQFSVGEIAGPSNACAYTGSNGLVATYSISSNDASTFQWTVPPQVTVVSGQGTGSLNVRFKSAFKEGSLSVQVSSVCGDAPVARTFQIGKTAPSAPDAVVGPAVVCDLIETGETATYSVTPNPTASGYKWTLPAQTMLVSGQGTNTIQVKFLEKFRLGNIRVRTVSRCGTSANFAYGVTSKGPGRPGPIIGQSKGICGDNSTIEYNIEPVRFAASYSWTTSVAGAQITSDGTHATIKFPAFSSGSVNVSAAGNCIVSGVRSLGVSSKGGDPDSISGPALACAGSVQTFSVEAVAGATSYEWTVPEGSVINSGAGTPNISVTIGEAGGAVTVRASTECDPGTPVVLDVAVEACDGQEPEQPSCKVGLFPIPTSGNLHVTFHTLQRGSYHIYITDAITGCVLFCSKGCYEAGDNDIPVELCHLKDGYYLIHVITNECNLQERIEIKH